MIWVTQGYTLARNELRAGTVVLAWGFPGHELTSAGLGQGGSERDLLLFGLGSLTQCGLFHA